MPNLLSVIDRFRQATVLCVGDVMLDKFVYGNVERISPEAPIPVLHYQHETEMLGGAGNVIRNVASLGGHTIFISVVGDDAIDQDIQLHLKQLLHCQYFLVKDTARRTTLKTRYIAAHQQVLRIDHETVHPLDDTIQAQIYRHFCDHIQECDVVVLSDYGKGLLSPELNKMLIDQARLYHKPVIVDPKSHNFHDYNGATIITPNLKEFEAATKAKITDTAHIKNHAQLLQQHIDFEAILVTRGSDGMSLFGGDDHEYHLPTMAQEVFDVSGAGDTVVATFALAYASKATLFESMQLANYAAGLVVAKLGTASVSESELRQCLSQEKVTITILDTSLATAQKQIEQWQSQGLRIGFTNGCFDIIHPGHTNLLTQAKQQCDKLIVGLNSDTSVRHLKGASRPINTQQDRAAVLSQLRSVDHVVVFEEPTPVNLIKALRPDVLIKGKDYTVDQIAGAQEVLSWGGEIYLADLIEGKSTTKIISKC